MAPPAVSDPAPEIAAAELDELEALSDLIEERTDPAVADRVRRLVATYRRVLAACKAAAPSAEPAARAVIRAILREMRPPSSREHDARAMGLSRRLTPLGAQTVVIPPSVRRLYPRIAAALEAWLAGRPEVYWASLEHDARHQAAAILFRVQGGRSPLEYHGLFSAHLEREAADGYRESVSAELERAFTRTVASCSFT